MKRIKTRRKNLRITNPIGFSLFIAGILLALGLIAVLITLGVGYGGDAVRYVQDQIQGTVEEINEQPTFTPEPILEATTTPEPVQTPEVGTPAPTGTPTPKPIGDLDDTPAPTPDVNSPLYGYVIGINPMRDAGSEYKEECEFNLEFAKKIASYLENRGATVVLTRESNDITMNEKQRGQVLKRANCDIAFEIVCNHLSSKSRGCYVRYGASGTYAKQLATAYQQVTDIPFQSNHKSGIYKKTENVIHYCGCPCVRLILGNWDNAKDRAVIEDDAMQQKICEVIYNVILGRLKG